MIRSIVLDLDGPLLDGKLRHYACFSDILRENGFEPIPVDEYWEMKRNRVDRRGQLAACGAGGMYDLFLRSWLDRIETPDYLSLDRLQPGVTDVLAGWKRQGIRLILVTLRNNEENLHPQLESLGLNSLLDVIVCVGSSGGAEAKAAAALAALGECEKSSVLWIGDTEIDIAAARLAGVSVCAVECGLRTSASLNELEPDFMARGLNDLDISEMNTRCVSKTAE